MNTDDMVQNAKIRSDRLAEKMDCRRCKNFNCAKVDKYARDQNTVYDPQRNLMLYGINSNMGVLGVSDGTCKQINPLMFTAPYMCGFGAAGGNPCVKDAYNIENFESGTSNKWLQDIVMLVVIILLIIWLIRYCNDKNN